MNTTTRSIRTAEQAREAASEMLDILDALADYYGLTTEEMLNITVSTAPWNRDNLNAESDKWVSIMTDGGTVTECVYDPEDDTYSVHGDKAEGTYPADSVNVIKD